ncbi:MAG: sialate O-acetylesterase [Verrucomicrobiota bacterium]
MKSKINNLTGQVFCLAGLSLLLLGSIRLHGAEFKLASIFSDHAIFQRGAVVPIWGWAEAGTMVRAQFAGQTKTATADAKGKWLVKLDALPACAEPRTLTVTSDATTNTIVRRDILVGEVWLGSGQSNMELPVRRATNYAQEQASANLPKMRMYTEELLATNTAQADGKGQWLVCTPDSVGGFSATLFFFGRELYQKLGVPVGLINSSVGGTPIERWIAPEAQSATKALDAFCSTAPASKAELGGLFHGMIAPLIPYAICGTIWYQGETSAYLRRAPFYQFQLPLLVKDWRARWGYDFPFAWVQLPGYDDPRRNLPLVREAMLKTLSLPYTGMAITIDIGSRTNIHPPNKQDVGHRLAQWALGKVYGLEVPSTSGPLPAAHEIRGAEAVLNFSHTEGGLVVKGGALTGFVIAGADHLWKPAQARIEGDTVVVSSPEVKTPVAVRYAWENYPACNLYNGAGLPASPFRTDDWKPDLKNAGSISANDSRPVTVIVSDNPGGKDLPPNFLGLSYEMSMLLPKNGHYYFDASDTALVNTFKTLGIKSLRVGANAVDDKRIAVPQEKDIDALFGFARAAGVKVIYSFRLQNGNPAESARLATYIQAHYANLLDCYTIGNEPDLFKPKLNYEEYLALWKPHYEAILKAVPDAKFGGPSVNGNIPGKFALNMARDFYADGHMAWISEHHYFLGNGRMGETNAPLTRARFLNVTNHSTYAMRYERMAAVLASNGVPCRLDELNNCFHGGSKDASDTYAATLWALDCTHWWATRQLLGMNYHTGERVGRDGCFGAPNYAAFLRQDNGSGYTMCPPAYAYSAFAQGARGRPLQLKIESSSPSNISAYAYRDKHGSFYLTLINLTFGDDARPAEVSLRLPGKNIRGEWQRLDLAQKNANVAAKTGITLGEAVIDPQGKWKPKWINIEGGDPNNLSAHIPPASAAILHFIPAGRLAEDAISKTAKARN